MNFFCACGCPVMNSMDTDIDARCCNERHTSQFLKDLTNFPKRKTKCRFTKHNKHDYECMDSIIINFLVHQHNGLNINHGLKNNNALSKQESLISTPKMVDHHFKCTKLKASTPAQVQNGKQKITYNHDNLV